MDRLRLLLRSRDEGASAVEYALLLAGFVAVCVAVVVATFQAAGRLYDTDCENVGEYAIAGAPDAC